MKINEIELEQIVAGFQSIANAKRSGQFPVQTLGLG
jgi:hypothetical protein